MKKFQLGDKVRVLRDFPINSCWERGHVGVVTELDEAERWVRLDDTGGGWITSTIGEDAELVESASEVSDQRQDGVIRTFKAGDLVRVLVDRPDGAFLYSGDVVRVNRVYSPGSMTVHIGWSISAVNGEHAELADESVYIHKGDDISDHEDQATPDQAYDDDVAIDKVQAESLCRLYAQYREHHGHDDAFRIAWEIEAEGLPF